MRFAALFAIATAGRLFVQPAKPIQSQSPSSITLSKESDGADAIEIRNVSFDVIDRIMVRQTVHSKRVVGDIGSDSTVTLEAWKFGDDPRQKPIYSINASGTEGHIVESEVFLISRGLEEVDWWSLYKLTTGQHLLDTYVPLVSFSTSRDTVENRYAGLEVPPDETTDARLKQPNVIAVLSYASADRVLREALLTSDDPKQAALLRSFADTTRALSFSSTPQKSLRITFSQNYPSAPNTVEVIVPLTASDLDLAHAKLPAKLHIAAWKR